MYFKFCLFRVLKVFPDPSDLLASTDPLANPENLVALAEREIQDPLAPLDLLVPEARRASRANSAVPATLATEDSVVCVATPANPVPRVTRVIWAPLASEPRVSRVTLDRRALLALAEYPDLRALKENAVMLASAALRVSPIMRNAAARTASTASTSAGWPTESPNADADLAGS